MRYEWGVIATHEESLGVCLSLVEKEPPISTADAMHVATGQLLVLQTREMSLIHSCLRCWFSAWKTSTLSTPSLTQNTCCRFVLTVEGASVKKQSDQDASTSDSA